MLWEHKLVGECFHSFFEFSQTFTSVSISPKKHGKHFFYFFWKIYRSMAFSHLAFSGNFLTGYFLIHKRDD